MTSESKSADQDRPAATIRMHSGLENLLSANITSRSKAKSHARTSNTPQLERSVSSMTDSFMLEHWMPSSRPSSSKGNGQSSSQHPSSQNNDTLTPISNWAHLSYIKEQRNALRGEIKTHQIAGAEAKRSLTSLRHLAFRMAVRSATTTKNLVQSRKNHYLEGRDAERRIEDLKRALRIEEGRNQDILEALERASMLTLQYSNPAPSRRQSGLLSPPPSPPTRLSRTSSCHETSRSPALGSATPSGIRASDVRLTKAKQESIQALVACRNRIEELQAESTKWKEDSELLDKTREALEQELQVHQLRITTLEELRIEAEETLKATRLHLNKATCSEQKIEQELLIKSNELARLENCSGEKQKTIESVLKEREFLEEALQARELDIEELSSNAIILKESLVSLEQKIDVSERQEAALRDCLAEEKIARENARKQLDQSSQHLDLLRQQLANYEVEAAEQSKQIETDNNTISALHEQLQQSGNERKTANDLLSTMKADITLLTANLQRENDTRDNFVRELESTKIAQEATEHHLGLTRERLQQETEAKTRFQDELEAVLMTRDALEADVQRAQEKIQSLEGNAYQAQSKLESIQDMKAALDADLRDARQSLFKLREKLTLCSVELAEVEASKLETQQKLQTSEEWANTLVAELEQAHKAEAEASERHTTELQMSKDQLCRIEDSMAEAHETSRRLQAELQNKLNDAQMSNDSAEKRLGQVLQQQLDLEGEVHRVQSMLQITQTERSSLQARVTQYEDDLSRSSQSEIDLEARLISSYKDLEALTDLVSNLENSLNESFCAKAEVDQAFIIMQTERDSSCAETGHLRDQLKIAADAREEAEEKFHDAMSEQVDLTTHLSTLDSKLAQMEFKVSLTGSELSTLQEQIMMTQQAKREAEERLESLHETHSGLSHKLVHTQSRLQSVEAEVKQLKSDLSDTEEELMAVHRKKAESEKRLVAATEINADLETQLSIVGRRKADVEERLDSALKSNAQLEEDLGHSQSQMRDIVTQNSDLTSTLFDTSFELESLRQLKAEIEDKLKDAVTQTAQFKKELELSRSELGDMDLQNASLRTKLMETDSELGFMQKNKADMETRFAHGENRSTALSDDLSVTTLALGEVRKENAALASQLTEANAQVEQWRSRNGQLGKELDSVSHYAAGLELDFRAARMQLDISESESTAVQSLYKQLEDQFHTASQRTAELESDLHLVKMQLQKAESDSALFGSKAVEADQELKTLRNTNVDLDFRLTSAEHNLDMVRETNARLEAFLEQVEKDMATAEAAVEESERCLEEFVHESQAKLDAARSSKLKYKRGLSDRNNENQRLIIENSELRSQVEEQSLALELFRGSKEELMKGLSNEDENTSDNSSTSDIHPRFVDCVDERLNDVGEDISEREALESSHGDTHSIDADLLVSSSASLEQEVETEKGEIAAPEGTKNTPIGENKVAVKPDPMETKIPSETSSTLQLHKAANPQLTPFPPSSSHDDRPITSSSINAHEADPNTYTQDLESVRKLRNDQSAQLKKMKQETADLKKSLKTSTAQLHQLERTAARPTPKRQRTLLRKRRTSSSYHPHPPSLESSPAAATAAELPHTLSSRPATSGGFSFMNDLTSTLRHHTGATHERPKSSTLDLETQRWSMFSTLTHNHTPTTAGSSSAAAAPRPATSHSMMMGIGAKRDKPVVDIVGAGASARKKRTWSLEVVKNLFRREREKMREREREKEKGRGGMVA